MLKLLASPKPRPDRNEISGAATPKDNSPKEKGENLPLDRNGKL